MGGQPEGKKSPHLQGFCVHAHTRGTHRVCACTGECVCVCAHVSTCARGVRELGPVCPRSGACGLWKERARCSEVHPTPGCSDKETPGHLAPLLPEGVPSGLRWSKYALSL